MKRIAAIIRTDHRIVALLAVALMASLPGPARAGRPLATEDAGVLSRGECEFESYAGRQWADDSPRARTLWAQLGCGVGAKSQLALGAGNEKFSGERTTVAAVSGKTSLRELTETNTGVALAYALLGARAPGGSFRHESTEIKAVVTVPRGEWLFHGNLGARIPRRDGVYSTLWGVAAERPEALGPLDLMAEVFGDNHSEPWVQVGARWSVVPKRFFLDASWGVHTDDARARQVSVGLKIAF